VSRRAGTKSDVIYAAAKTKQRASTNQEPDGRHVCKNLAWSHTHFARRWLSVISDSEHCEGVTLGWRLTTDSSNIDWGTPLPFSLANRGGAHRRNLCAASLQRQIHTMQEDSKVWLNSTISPSLVWTYIVHLIRYGDAVACPPASLLLFNSSWVA